MENPENTIQEARDEIREILKKHGINAKNNCCAIVVITHLNEETDQLRTAVSLEGAANRVADAINDLVESNELQRLVAENLERRIINSLCN